MTYVLFRTAVIALLKGRHTFDNQHRTYRFLCVGKPTVDLKSVNIE